MKTKLFKLILPVIVFSFTALFSCSEDNGRNNSGNKDNDNRGNHATDPSLPSDAEYPGSKTYDSLRTRDSANHK